MELSHLSPEPPPEVELIAALFRMCGPFLRNQIVSHATSSPSSSPFAFILPSHPLYPSFCFAERKEQAALMRRKVFPIGPASVLLPSRYANIYNPLERKYDISSLYSLLFTFVDCSLYERREKRERERKRDRQ
jgi:hypothetical protein